MKFINTVKHLGFLEFLKYQKSIILESNEIIFNNNEFILSENVKKSLGVGSCSIEYDDNEKVKHLVFKDVNRSLIFGAPEDYGEPAVDSLFLYYTKIFDPVLLKLRINFNSRSIYLKMSTIPVKIDKHGTLLASKGSLRINIIP